MDMFSRQNAGYDLDAQFVGLWCKCLELCGKLGDGVKKAA
jgi:hypothetical protein